MSAGERTLRLDVAYDGTEFAGWQVQPEKRTVQGVLERVLTKLNGDRRVRVRGAGRTDSGVHARGQVADCRLDVALSDEKLAYRLRRMLPRDVRAVRVRTAAAGFHARHDAVRKAYAYRMDLTSHGDPLDARFALHFPYALDPARVLEAIELLPGRRDWSGFAAAACQATDPVKDLEQARFEQPARDCGRFLFVADGFLQFMVRNLVGTLLEIGAGRMEVARIEKILAAGDRKLAGPTAPARGLCLERVVYPEDLA